MRMRMRAGWLQDGHFWLTRGRWFWRYTYCYNCGLPYRDGLSKCSRRGR
jgi:hypothetical protein